MNSKRRILKYCCFFLIISQTINIKLLDSLFEKKIYIKKSKNYYWLLSSLDE